MKFSRRDHCFSKHFMQVFPISPSMQLCGAFPPLFPQLFWLRTPSWDPSKKISMCIPNHADYSILSLTTGTVLGGTEIIQGTEGSGRKSSPVEPGQVCTPGRGRGVTLSAHSHSSGELPWKLGGHCTEQGPQHLFRRMNSEFLSSMF